MNNEKQIIFYNANSAYFNVHGLPFASKEHPFWRLPDDVFISQTIEFLKQHPSGAYLSFATASPSIRIKASVSSKAYMPHMTATGTLGCDLYIRKQNSWVFLATTKVNEENYDITIVEGLPSKRREYRLYLPLYIALNHLAIGIEENYTIEATEPIKPEKIVFYGTSITQGGCATRPGMNTSSIVGRTVDYEIINLGFSGSAHLEPEMATVIAQLKDIKLLILEVEANAGDALVLKDRLENFVNIISQTQSHMKVMLISHYPYALAAYKAAIKARFVDHYHFQKQLCHQKGWEFVDGEVLLRKLNFEESVDGVHLTDLGFYFLAVALKKRIKNLLG